MLIFPAIDLYDGKAVRLYKGDYAQMTVYSENPPEIAETFYKAGAACLHLVDLEGAKTGETPNLETIRRIREAAPLFIEVGGGVRSMEVVERYLNAGIDRVILGTAAVTDPVFLRGAVETYKEKIAVAADPYNGVAARHYCAHRRGCAASYLAVAICPPVQPQGQRRRCVAHPAHQRDHDRQRLHEGRERRGHRGLDRDTKRLRSPH
jgi:imidazole glycerol phosphate synthase subunit HisF